jgi:hypothetical protein
VPKKEGGLGIKMLAVWNIVSMLNHIWNLFSLADSLWVAWIHHYRLKGRSFWEVSIPQNCPWSWKKLLSLRNVAKQFIKFKVGDGSSIFLCHDMWHPVDCLLDRYGHRVMYDASLSIGPKLSIIRRDDWFWPHARSEAIVEIQSRLHEVELGEADQPVWDSRSSKFFSADTWEKLREKKLVVEWHDVVWFSAAIPRHAFFLWLAFKDAIFTREHMCRWGYSGDNLCLFCRSRQENKDHLFFECSLSKRVWRALMADCGIVDPPLSWNTVAIWSL